MSTDEALTPEQISVDNLMAEIVAEDEPAPNIYRLDTALRLVTRLRKRIKDLQELSEPADDEYAIFLDDEHARMLEELFNNHYGFTIGPDDPRWGEELEDVNDLLSDIAEGAIDVAWDSMRHDRQPKIITPTA